MLSLLLCLSLVGCSSEDEIFGETGTFGFRIGQDAFGNGDQGAFGGEEVTEPHTNEFAYRFDDFGVKTVEDAPIEDKVLYDFSGPENDGITSTTTLTNSTAPAGGKASNMKEKTVVVLTCAGRAGGTVDKIEISHKNGYYYFMKDVAFLLKEGGLDIEVDSEVVEPTRISASQFVRDVYSLVTGTDISQMSLLTDAHKKEVLKKMQKFGIIRETKKKEWVANAKFESMTDSSMKKIINKYSKNVDKFIAKLNKKKILEIDNSNLTVKNELKCLIDLRLGYNTEPHVNKYFTRWQQGDFEYGSSKKTITDFQINYETMQVVGTMLTGAGYKVEYGMTANDSNELKDGNKISYKKTAEWAASTNGIAHLHFAWNNKSEKGMKLFVPKSGFSSLEKRSKKITKAMKAKGGDKIKSIEADASKYVLNWSTIPTVYVQVGSTDSDEYGAIYKDKNSKRIKLLKKWMGDYKDAILEGIKAIEDESSNAS